MDVGSVSSWLSLPVSVAALGLSTWNSVVQRRDRRASQAELVYLEGHKQLVPDFPASGDTVAKGSLIFVGQVVNTSPSSVSEVTLVITGHVITTKHVPLYRVKSGIERPLRVQVQEKPGMTLEAYTSINPELWFTDAQGRRWRRTISGPPRTARAEDMPEEVAPDVI
jgi:hypothetical protein